MSRFEGDLIGRSAGGDPSAPEGSPWPSRRRDSDRRPPCHRPDRPGGVHDSDGPGDRTIGRRNGARRHGWVAADPSNGVVHAVAGDRRPATGTNRRSVRRGAPRRACQDARPGAHDGRPGRDPSGRSTADGHARGWPGYAEQTIPDAVPSEPDVVHVHIGRVEVPARSSRRRRRRPRDPLHGRLDRHPCRSTAT